MVKTWLVKRSPLRILENALQGGLGKGNLAVLASRKGIGKTACLVHIALDRLFQDRPIIHVSYASRVDYIITWYEDIFKEIMKNRDAKAAAEIHDDLIRNRVIMNFKQDAARTDRVLQSIEAMITAGKFAADTIIVDGYDFGAGTPEDLRKFREFGLKLGLELWFSASLRGEAPVLDEKGFPLVLRPFLDEISVLITMDSRNDLVRLSLIKNKDAPAPGELPLKLDPRTLLIAE
ncbi:MAG: hypothetical protein A2Y69_09185 [Candidatus Aminicenantes bacterium RBG_13_59_9]|nr:MAG: hypothetical protein A2Y69_09185 [Candidatus Aminicenantes bacterium RBG_13_59_9]